MQLRIRSQEDFWAGLMFIAFGIVAVYFARHYPMGSTMRMGPGYFPTGLGALLVITGTLVSLRSFWTQGEGTGPWALRPLLVLGTAFAAFGFLVDDLGFVPALLVLIIGSVFARREHRPLEVVLLTAVLVAGAIGLFVVALGLPFRLFWWS